MGLLISALRSAKRCGDASVCARSRGHRVAELYAAGRARGKPHESSHGDFSLAAISKELGLPLRFPDEHLKASFFGFL